MIEEISQRKELYKEFGELGIPVKSLDPLPDAALQVIGMTRKDHRSRG
jgi:hypothetical protein